MRRWIRRRSRSPAPSNRNSEISLRGFRDFFVESPYFCSLRLQEHFNPLRKRQHMAAKALTKSEVLNKLADATQTSRKTAILFLESLVGLAYTETKKKGEFVIPGIGKLVKQKRKARTGINPKTGEKIKIAAKTVVKIRIAKAAKDAIFGTK
jgi:DNA-binding protein HU-beta